MATKSKTLTEEALQSGVHGLFFPENKADAQSVGLELEVWPLRQTKASPNELVRFYNEEGTGLIQLLQAMEGSVDGLAWEPSADGAPHFRLAGGGQLTFEPGGQLEYSGPPKTTLAEAIHDITMVIESLRCALKSHGIWFFHSGLNPWYTISEVGLQIQKERYLHMDRFFQAKGSYGQKMMRLSTSLQINLDAGDPETAQRRWLAANLAAPVFTALFGNSPFVEGKATGAYSYRSLIWQNLDKTRTGFPKGMLAPEYHPCPVKQYFDFAMDAHVIQLPGPDGRRVFDGRFHSFRHWMENGAHGYFPDADDWSAHLSTLFPEVRARGFFEIRFLDAQSKVWCAVPGILLTHLLYDPEARETVIRLLSPYRTTLPGMAQTAAKQGLDEPELASLSKRIFSLALDAGAKTEDAKVMELCERFYKTYTHHRRNPAAELVRLNGGRVFTAAQYRDFERAQVENAGDILDFICEYS